MHQLISTAAAVSAPTRHELLLVLGQGSRSIGELATALGVTSSTISHHVSVLEAAGLVAVTHGGRHHLVRRDRKAWARIHEAFAR